MSTDEPVFACDRPSEPDALRRFGIALLASAILHALALGWPEEHRPAGRLPAQVRPTPLLTTLMHPSAAPTRPAPPFPSPDIPVSVGPKVGADATPLSRKARFAEPPDFSAAESVPLPGAVRLHLRIQVTPQGRAGRIEIVESLRVPADFLVAVSEAISRAQFLPGEASGKPIDSNLELVIEASPPAEMDGAGAISSPQR